MPNKSYSQRLKEKEAQEKRDKRLLTGGLAGIAAAVFLWPMIPESDNEPKVPAPYSFDAAAQQNEGETSYVSFYDYPTEWQQHLKHTWFKSEISQEDFDLIPQSLLNNKDFLYAALSNNNFFYLYLPDELQTDHDIALYVKEHNRYAHESFPDSLYADKEFMTRLITEVNPYGYNQASDELKADREFLMLALSKSGNILRFAPEELRSDFDIVMHAVNSFGMALAYADEALKDNKEIVLAAVAKNNATLSHASARLQDDRDVVLTAVIKDGYSLEHASPRLQADKEIVHAAIAQNGAALIFADPKFLEDRQLVLQAVANDRRIETFKALPLDLRADKEIVEAAIEENAYAYFFASDDLQLDRDLAKQVIAEFPHNIQRLHPDLLADREFIADVLKYDYAQYKHIDDSLKDDIEIARAAVQSYPANYSHISDRLKQDRSFALEALTYDERLFQYFNAEFVLDPEIFGVVTNSHALTSALMRLDDYYEHGEIAAHAFYQYIAQSDEEIDIDNMQSISFIQASHSAMGHGDTWFLIDYIKDNPNWYAEAKATAEDAEAKFEEFQDELNSYWTWKPFKGFYPKSWDNQPRP